MRTSARARIHDEDGRARWFVPLVVAISMLTAAVAWAGDVHTDWADVETDVTEDATVVSAGSNAVTITLWGTGNFNSGGTVQVTNVYNMATDGTITPDTTSTTEKVFAAVNHANGQPFCGEAPVGLGCKDNPHVVVATLNVAAGTPDGTTGVLNVHATTSGVDNINLAAGYVIVEAGVTYVSNGFQPPVATGEWNKAKAGQGISLRWNLWEDEMTEESEVIDPTLGGGSYSIRSIRVACPEGDALDGEPALEDTAYAGNSSLRYDYEAETANASGQNVYVWKTDKSWNGSCRMLTVMYDGSNSEPPLVAYFDFRK